MSVTILIIIITCAISIPALSNRALFDRFKHHPYTEKRNKEYYRWLTSGFLHGSQMHLLINMFVLYQFGTVVEAKYNQMLGTGIGTSMYLFMYLLVIILANVPTYFKHEDNPYYAAIGASGGVSGVLFAFILFSPWSMLGLFFILPIPAIIFGVLYLWYESWAAKNQNDNIGHEAHFYGAIAGIIITIILKPSVASQFVDRLINGMPF